VTFVSIAAPAQSGELSDVTSLNNGLAELNARKEELEDGQRERDRIERRLSQIETEIEESDVTIQELQAERKELTDEIEVIETEVDEPEEETYRTVLQLHKEANQLEYELGRLETDLERVESEIDNLERRIDQRDNTKVQLEEVKTEITELRTRIDRIEQAAIEEFNHYTETVLEMLDCANLDCIWVERVEHEVREGRRKVSRTIFELHVIRKSSPGVAYEDTVAHFSESEREVTGIVFALAGYLCHEVYEELPFMLLDSLEAIDAKRIATLVEYLNDYTGYLLVALLPEDAAALSDEYQRITEI